LILEKRRNDKDESHGDVPLTKSTKDLINRSTKTNNNPIRLTKKLLTERTFSVVSNNSDKTINEIPDDTTQQDGQRDDRQGMISVENED
jgi:hypothetical protein